jgi:hypothetical protein
VRASGIEQITSAQPNVRKALAGRDDLAMSQKKTTAQMLIAEAPRFRPANENGIVRRPR